MQNDIFTNRLVTLEKVVAPHSSTLAWKIPWMEEPGGVTTEWLNWTELNCKHFMFSSKVLRRRQWYPTPVLLPGESQGWGSLVGCCLWGRTVRHDWSDLAASAAQVLKETQSTNQNASSLILGKSLHSSRFVSFESLSSWFPWDSNVLGVRNCIMFMSRTSKTLRIIICKWDLSFHM